MATDSSYYYDNLDLNYTIYWDWSNNCDIDCLWDRERNNRLSVLRPLSVILALIGLVGIVGNIFVILVFSRTVKKRTSTYLVLTLAIIDLIACSIVIPGTLLKEWLFKFHIDFICKLWELMRNAAIISSATILAAIAFDRFLLVYRKTHQDGNKNVTLAMILIAIVTGAVLGVPPMLGVGVYMRNEDGEKINMKVCLPNDQLISAEGLFLYWQIVTSLFGLLILMIIILYMLIFVMVYKHSTQLNSRASTNSVMTSTRSQLLVPGTNVTPFIGFQENDKRKTIGLNSGGFQRTLSVTAGMRKMQSLFKSGNKTTKTGNKVITINVIENTSSSNYVPNQKAKGKWLQNSQRNTTSPSTSGFPNIKIITVKNNRGQERDKLSKAKLQRVSPRSHDQTTFKPTNQTLDIPGTPNTAVTSTNQKQALPMKNRSAHIKTTKVLCLITTVYIVAFLPMFLITHKALVQNDILFYFYFINNAANPIIYSFMNRKFRLDIWKMFSRKSNTVWVG